MMSLQIKYTKKTPFVNNVNMTLEMLLLGNLNKIEGMGEKVGKGVSFTLGES